LSLAQNRQSDELLQQGKAYIYKQDYKNAEKVLRKALNLKEVLPDEICYFYGISLSKLGNYEKGISFLVKYQELTKSQGTYSKSATELINEIGAKFCVRCKGTNVYYTSDTCSNCSGKGGFEAKCIACKGSGKVICNQCHGEKVKKTTNGLQVWYNDCNACKAHGWVVCVRCKGALKEYRNCNICKGNKVVSSKHYCTQHIKTEK